MKKADSPFVINANWHNKMSGDLEHIGSHLSPPIKSHTAVHPYNSLYAFKYFFNAETGNAQPHERRYSYLEYLGC